MDSPKYHLYVGVAAFVLSWVFMLLIGRSLIDWLKGLKGMKWSPREDTPDSHLQKAGTPSMGGIGIIGAAFGVFLALWIFFWAYNTFSPAVASVVARELSLRIYIWSFLLFPVIVALHALLGFVDDWSKAKGRGGLLARQKLLGQVILTGAFLSLWWLLDWDTFLKISYHDGAQFIFMVYFVGLALILIGITNAVNLTDGIDGLAAGLSVQCGLAMMLPLLHYGDFFPFPLVWGTPRESVWFISVSVFWLCLGGACLAFLAFNKYPAKVFMGDTGSLALGAALGAGAILTRSVFLLPFIGFIFWVEMFSVIFQVLYFKWTKRKTGEGKRIFRRAPLHHHFELGGWSEWRVVGTFWMVNLVASGIGLVLWQMGILPRFP